MYPSCATCGITIYWEPTVVGQAVYCCSGCAAGGPCNCDYGLLPPRGEHAAIIVVVEQRMVTFQASEQQRNHSMQGRD